MSITEELLLKYGEPHPVFDGLAWQVRMIGKDALSASIAEDPHEDEAHDALLEEIERKMWALCIRIETNKNV